jgi:hypothetical protein
MHNYTIVDPTNMTVSDTWNDDMNFLPYEEIRQKVRYFS